MNKSRVDVLFSVFIICFLVCSCYFSSCKKDFPRQAAVITENMNKQTAVATGKMIDLGQSAIQDHGFCWDSSGFPSVDGKILKLGSVSQTGDFTGKLPGLLPNKVYYLKAFVVSDGGEVYGDLLSFLTPDLPVVETDSVKDISETTALSGGTIISDGGSPVTGRGICWSETQNPDTSGLVYKDTIQSTGSFSYQITGLTGGKNYYIRAYAKSLYGIRYANEVTFTTGQPKTIPIVTTADVTNISLNTANSGGNVVSDGGSSVTERGVCWSTTPYPTTQSSKTTDGAGIGTFSSLLTGLKANTTYYIRAYATNGIGTGYGDEKSFTTSPDPVYPSVITTTVTGILGTSASSGGTVLEDGGAPVTSRGVCWSSNPSPTTTDNKTSDGSGVGSFTSSITGLYNSTKYYVRAYAINNVGTSYGNEINFTAGQSITAPTVTTTDVINITQTSTTCGGNVTNEGGASVTARGVCWGIFSSPTISNSHTTDGSGTGGFLSSITGLFSSTTYYVRAYATNSAGTSYGNERQFATLAEATTASVTTAPITNITNNSATSGGTVTNDGGSSVTARGVCWTTGSNPTITDPHTTNGTGAGNFVSQLTGLQSNTFYRVRAYATNSVGIAYGAQQTFSTNQDPILPTVTTAAAINITQTTATTGGTVMSDGGSPVTVRGVCYSTNPDPTTADGKTQDGSGTGAFVSNLTGLASGTLYYARAYAVNTIGTSYGNEITFTTLSAFTLPTVTTTNATNITQFTATSGGNVINDGGTSVTARGVCWSTSTSPMISDSHTSDGLGTGVFISNIIGLAAGTQYYVRAYATNNLGTTYGNEVTFTTFAPFSCGNIVAYDGKNYTTVQIGTQCWFMENLNVGTRINGSQSQTNNGVKEKYCYANLESNCDVYGGLYQWDEMMNYTTSSNTNPSGRQGICPSGWHLPSDAEWCQMETYLDATVNCTATGQRGIDAGGKMKEVGIIHWTSPNTGATNASSFTALPGGRRDINETFGLINDYDFFWSSSEYLSSTTNAWNRNLNYLNGHVSRVANEKTFGHSGRCLKD